MGWHSVRVPFEGTATTQGGSQLYCEWREYPGAPYFHTGPRIAIRDGKLTAPGNPPLPVPAGEWFHVEMSASQGDQADGTWQLTVAFPGEPPKQYDLKTASPPFRVTTWLGFVSDGTQPTVYYLDNLHLSSDIGGGQPADARAER